MKKMSFNLFGRFILWLKKIFHIRPKSKDTKKTIEITQPLEEESTKVAPADENLGEVSPQEEKLVDAPLTQKKTEIASVNQRIPPQIFPEEEIGEVKLAKKPPELPQEQETPTTEYAKKETPSEDLATEEPVEEKLIEALPSGERPGEIPSEKERGEAKPLEEKTPEVPQVKKAPSEIPPEPSQVSVEEVAKTKTQKPNKKTAPIEERTKERKKPLEDEKKPDVPKQRGKIDLGDIKRKKLRPAKQPQQPTEVSLKKTGKASEEKETPTRVESPYVEINLDEAKVSFIIPEQQFKTTTVNNVPQQLSYKLRLNNENEQTISVRVSNNAQGITTVEEKRIYLEQPFKNFEIVYPDEIQGRVYSYQHSNEILYPFIAIGNNRGRMHYLYDKKGNINPLPRKDVLFLLKEDFELNTDPDVIEERWIWGTYQPMCISLKNTNELVVKTRQTGEEKKIPCEPSFSVECDALIEDDFKKQMPLFSGNSIKIKAPTVNPSGWVIWIQNKKAGYKVITENWTGSEPLELKLPDDLPCECGEFQVDICEQEDRISIETLFFRYIPYLQLRYPRGLIIPEANTGHKQEIIEIILEQDSQEWKLKHNENFQSMHIENGYQIKLTPQRDALRFSLMKKDKPETETSFKITIPRLKWRTSKQKTWADNTLQVKRDELIRDTEFYLQVCTNDFNAKYDFSAILETNSQMLQKAEFIRKGIVHNILLNMFYDTIRKNEDKITLKMEIRKAKNAEVLGQVEVIHFPEIMKEELNDKLQKSLALIKPPKKGLHLKLLKRRKVKKDIMPFVKSSSGRMRKGKGFSRREIGEAEINLTDIRCLHIPFDKRRKSTYSENVKFLKSLTRGE